MRRMLAVATVVLLLGAAAQIVLGPAPEAPAAAYKPEFKHITFWHYAIDPVILAASGETWKTLSPEDRDIVRKAGDEVMAWEKKAAREARGPDGGVRRPRAERDGAVRRRAFARAHLVWYTATRRFSRRGSA